MQVIVVLPAIIVGALICYWPQARELAARRGELVAHYLRSRARREQQMKTLIILGTGGNCVDIYDAVLAINREAGQ